MRMAVYARVSTESQEARGTTSSQLAALKDRITQEGHDLVAEYCDDGHSGARLDRPGLDALRDGAEAGLFEAVWCLSPDRLARATPTRCSCSTSSSAFMCACCSATPRLLTMIRRLGFSPKSKV